MQSSSDQETPSSPDGFVMKRDPFVVIFIVTVALILLYGVYKMMARDVAFPSWLR